MQIRAVNQKLIQEKSKKFNSLHSQNIVLHFDLGSKMSIAKKNKIKWSQRKQFEIISNKF